MSQESAELVRKAVAAFNRGELDPPAAARDWYQPDIVVFKAQWARGKGSGAEVEIRNAWVFSFRDGKIQRIAPYWNHAEALEAVGLSA